MLEEILEFIVNNNIHIFCLQDTGNQSLSYYEFQKRNLIFTQNKFDPKDPSGRIATIFQKNIQLKLLPQEQNRIQVFQTPFPTMHCLNNMPNMGNTDFTQSIINLTKIQKNILLGDFNSVADPKFDKFSNYSLQSQTAHKNISILLREGLKDSFRKLHPDDRKYTRWGSRTTSSGDSIITLSRIDYILCSTQMQKKLKSCDILESNIFNSDHRIGTSSFETELYISPTAPRIPTIKKN